MVLQNTLVNTLQLGVVFYLLGRSGYLDVYFSPQATPPQWAKCVHVLPKQLFIPQANPLGCHSTSLLVTLFRLLALWDKQCVTPVTLSGALSV